MALDPSRKVTVAVQVLPLVEDVYPVVDRAIQVIAQSGVQYEVGPMETVMEGQIDELLGIAKSAHLTCLEAGADQVVTIIKISDRADGTSIEETVGKYRTGK
ncbi:MAG: thiamine-binding protein [Anaerolineae bacterium]|nr:MAG: thiamine-binding protein [Anaerolineae bacterium]